MSANNFPVNTAELSAFLPHRQPMVWVDEVLACEREAGAVTGSCRILLGRERAFHDADGSVRTSAVVEWIAQGYGFVKACQRRADGFGAEGFGRAFLVGITDCEVDLSKLEGEKLVHVHVRELRDMHPAYVVEGRVTSEDGTRIFGRARIKVFGGELPA